MTIRLQHPLTELWSRVFWSRKVLFDVLPFICDCSNVEIVIAGAGR